MYLHEIIGFDKDIFLHLSNEKGEKILFCLVEKTVSSPEVLKFCEKEEATERMFHEVPACSLYKQQLTKIKIFLTAGKAYSWAVVFTFAIYSVQADPTGE